MVCQAAGQTKFKALKHENGVAGSSTIIVRVIDCFQPLQDCQIVRCDPQAQAIVYYNMDEDCRSWPDQQHFDDQTLNFNSTSAFTRQFMGSQNQLPSHMYPWHATMATGQDITLPSMTKLPQFHFDNGERHGWFYCLSTFRQAMFPPSNYVLKENLLEQSPATDNKDDNHDAGQQFPQKQFLVFGQTGDQTTMIFSSGVGAPPVHCLSHWKEKQADTSILQQRRDGSNMMGNADALLMDDFVYMSKFEEDLGSDLQSKMHEDTEELNALMYSDDDTDSNNDDDEDEVTSTGHSPSTLTIHDKQNEFADIKEEVASSDENPTKRQKLSNGRNVITLDNDHIIMNHSTFVVDDDTESQCGSVALGNSRETLSLSGKKRSRKAMIRERVHKLHSMIPCGNSANPIEVIDDAINFLLSLKLKAKALGFDSAT